MADFSALGQLVSTFRTDSYVLKRTTPARDYDEAGKIFPSTPTETTIEAAVFPLTGDALIFDKQGYYSRDQISIYSRDLLYVSTATQEADVLTVGDNDYTVIQAQNWSQGGFYAATGVVFV